MTVYLEPNELQSSRMPAITGAIPLPGLEAETGADLLITPLDLPAHTPELRQVHYRAGALLVQRKSGMDLVASIGERLGESLWKMRQHVGRPAQRLLLFVGVITSTREGLALIDGREATFEGRPCTFRQVSSTFRYWRIRGGAVEVLSRDGLIPDWCAWCEEDLRRVQAEPEVWAMPKPVLELPDEDDPLQMPMRVRDARLVLAALPGMGPARINEVWRWCGEDLGLCLMFLTDEDSARLPGRPAGVGLKTIQNIRRHLGLPEGVVLVPMSKDEPTKPHLGQPKPTPTLAGENT